MFSASQGCCFNTNQHQRDDEILTAEDSCGLNLECDLDRRTRVARARRGDLETRSAPASVDLALARSERRECRGIAPGEVDSTQRGAVVAVVLLGETTVRGCVLCVQEEEAIRKVLDRRSERRKGGRVRCIGAGGDRGRELTEERERGAGDVERALLVPDDE